MGNLVPSLVQCTNYNVPTPSSLTKQKIQCYTVALSRLYRFKKSKSGSNNNTIETTNKGDNSSSTALTKDQEKDDRQEKGIIRVKVLLTKKEAAKLLSMSVKGDKTIGQIMTELKKMEVHEMSFNSRNGAWRPVLESIPEELVTSA